jgi:hypothetical protein
LKKTAQETVKHAGIMKSAKEAVVFALNYTDQQYALSPMAAFLKHSGGGSGRGLNGLDGAGQAGMVWAEIACLPYYQALAIIARCTAHRLRCTCGSPCCSGWRANEMWTQVTSQLCDHSLQALAGHVSNRRLRLASTEKVFGAKVTLDEVAVKVGVSKSTAARQHAKIKDLLRTLEHHGWEALTAALEEKGMLIDASEVAV